MDKSGIHTLLFPVRKSGVDCAATDFGAGGQANPHGTNHSVMADSVHNQIYVPIASTAFTGQSVPAICTTGGGVDANGCIAVYQVTGSDP